MTTSNVFACVRHLYDCCRLFPFLHYVQFGSAVSLIVSDADGELRGLQPLKTVALAATPLIDVLREGERQEMHFKAVKRKISVVFDMVTVVVTGGNSKCCLSVVHELCC